MNDALILAGVSSIDGATIGPGAGGLRQVAVNTPACTAEVYLHGGHVTAWQPVGAGPVLFVSTRSAYQDGKAIRGGVPICFPWFGPASADIEARHPAPPLHGYARTNAWQLRSLGRSGADITMTFGLPELPARGLFWPFDADVRFHVQFGSNLQMKLEVTSRHATPMRYEAALHTYFAVSDVHQTRVHGLRGTRFLDKTRGMAAFVEENDFIEFHGETDRVYQDTTATCTIEDRGAGRRLVNEKIGSASTVVWNPAEQKGRDIGIADAEWKQFVCVETAAVGDCAIRLNPGESHTLGAIVSVG